MEDVVQKAHDWAVIYHANQKYLDSPYMKHLQDVVNVLWEFGHHTDDLFAAAWLHDILEDTSCPLMLLLHEFGNEITELVHAVTDGQGGTRRQKNAEAYRKMQLVPRATIVKLADRIANVRASIESGTKHLEMYQHEHHEFSNSLPKLAEAQPMWDELERLLR